MPWKLKDLKPNPENPRTISRVAFSRLKQSIARDPKFMVIRPVVIDENNVIMGGHQRVRACISLGMKEVPDEWVRRADDLTEEEKRRFILLDNSPEEVSGGFDLAKVNAHFSDAVKSLREQFNGHFEEFDDSAKNACRVLKEKDEKYKRFIEARQKSHQHGENAAGVGYYFVVVCQNRAQNEEFLSVLAGNGVPVEYGIFVDGVALSERIGVELPPCQDQPLKVPFDQSLADMSMEPGGEQDNQEQG